MKKSGYDLIVIEGKSPEPVYLDITGQKPVIRPAAHLWGKTTHEAEDIIRAEVAATSKVAKKSVACIGPAGEKQVLFASIINDKHRAAGRSGVGTVMGSKNLKAVIVGGDKRNTNKTHK